MSLPRPMSSLLTSLFAVLLLAIVQPMPAVAAAQPPEDLGAFSRDLTEVAERCRAATVGIVIPGGSMGSGVIVSEDGLVMTAAHVLPEAGGDVVIVTADGKQLQAKALGVNRTVDSGFAKITEPGPYPTAPIAEAGTVWEGDWVIAFGHGGGVQTDRPTPMRLGRALHISSDTSPIRWITTDCTVISGDSGGPLFDLEGNVIGIHSNIGMSVLVNRHVPISAYHAQWDQLHKPVEFNQPPAPAQPLIPGLDLLPDAIERQIARRLNDGDEALRKTLEANRDADGRIDMSPEEVAEMLGQESALQQIEDYRNKLAERQALTDKIENAGQEKDDEEESEVARRSAETRQMILDKLRERALDNIAEELRQANGKIAEHVLALFDPAVRSAGSCTVEVVSRGQVVALGTIVREDGYIVTKASELRGPTRVRMGDKELFARVVNGNGPNDLVLLKVDAEGLTPVRWAEQTPALGSLLVVPNPSGKPLAMGIVGVDARAIPERNNTLHIAPPAKPFLGVAGLETPEEAQGVRVGAVPDEGPAKSAGVEPGDVITAINGDAIQDVQALVEAVGEAKVGDELTLTVQRGEQTLELTVELAKRPGEEQAARPQRDDRQSAAQVYSARGGKLSDRRTNFPLALTHDAIIWAPDVGGPVLNLNGEAVGLNIARYGRTATYALPADHAKTAIEQMMRGR